jgi:hypothetical protein
MVPVASNMNEGRVCDASPVFESLRAVDRDRPTVFLKGNDATDVSRLARRFGNLAREDVSYLAVFTVFSSQRTDLSMGFVFRVLSAHSSYC